MPKRKLNIPGRGEVWGEDVDFETDREGFNTYILHDGTKLKMKTVVTEVIRLDEYNANGEPMYLVNSKNIVSAIVPENLKRKQG